MKELFSKLSVKVAAAVIAAVVVIGAAVVLVKADVFTKAETVVEHALDSLMENEEESAFESVFGLKTLFGKMQEQGAELEAGFAVSDLSGALIGLDGITIPKAGLSLSVRSDVKNSRVGADLNLKVADTTLASLNLYADAEQLQVAVPQFFSSVLSVPYASPDFIEKAKQAYISELAGIPDSLWEMLEASMQVQKDGKELTQSAKELKEGLAELRKELYADMEAKKNGTVKVSEAGDVKCKGYTAVFPEASIEHYLEDSTALLLDYVETVWSQPEADLDALREACEEMLSAMKEGLGDVTLSLALKGDRVVSVRVTGWTTPEDEENVVCEVVFGLEGNYLDNLIFTCTKEGETQLLVVHATRNEKEEFSSSWTVISEGQESIFDCAYDKLSGDFQFSLEADKEAVLSVGGAVTELKRGEAVAVEVHSLTVSENGTKETAPLELAFACRPLEGTVEPISSDTENVLEMDEADWNALMMQVYIKLFSLLGTFGGLIN